MATFGLRAYDVGMVKVSVLHPNVEGGKFDLEFFVHRHLPLIDRVWGAALIRREIDAGLVQVSGIVRS